MAEDRFSVGRVEIGRRLLGDINQFPFTSIERDMEDKELLGDGTEYKHLHLRIDGYVKDRKNALAAGDDYLEEIIRSIDLFHTEKTHIMGNSSYLLHSISWTQRGTSEDFMHPYCIAFCDLVAVYEEQDNG